MSSTKENVLNIDTQTTDTEADTILSAASYFVPHPLKVRDYESTITANSNEKTANYIGGQVMSLFGNVLDEDAKNIKGLGIAFTQYDEMLANMIGNE